MGIHVAKYLRPGQADSDLLALRGADACGLGEAENHATEVKLREVREQLDRAGVNDADPTKDFRYWQGMIQGLTWRRDLIAAATRAQEP